MIFLAQTPVFADTETSADITEKSAGASHTCLRSGGACTYDPRSDINSDSGSDDDVIYWDRHGNLGSGSRDTSWSIMNMPNFTKEQIFGLQRVFVMYSKFPKTRWPEIKKAEAMTPEGDEILNKLKDEFLATYFQDPEPAINKVNIGNTLTND